MGLALISSNEGKARFLIPYPTLQSGWWGVPERSLRKGADGVGAGGYGRWNSACEGLRAEQDRNRVVLGGHERGGVCVAGTLTLQSRGAHGEGRAHRACSDLSPEHQGLQRGNGSGATADESRIKLTKKLSTKPASRWPWACPLVSQRDGFTCRASTEPLRDPCSVHGWLRLHQGETRKLSCGASLVYKTSELR